MCACCGVQCTWQWYLLVFVWKFHWYYSGNFTQRILSTIYKCCISYKRGSRYLICFRVHHHGRHSCHGDLEAHPHRTKDNLRCQRGKVTTITPGVSTVRYYRRHLRSRLEPHYTARTQVGLYVARKLNVQID